MDLDDLEEKLNEVKDNLNNIKTKANQLDQIKITKQSEFNQLLISRNNLENELKQKKAFQISTT